MMKLKNADCCGTCEYLKLMFALSGECGTFCFKDVDEKTRPPHSFYEVDANLQWLDNGYDKDFEEKNNYEFQFYEKITVQLYNICDEFELKEESKKGVCEE